MTTQVESLREALVSLAKSEVADLGRLMQQAIAAGDRDSIFAAVARHVDARARWSRFATCWSLILKKLKGHIQAGDRGARSGVGKSFR